MEASEFLNLPFIVGGGADKGGDDEDEANPLNEGEGVEFGPFVFFW